MLSDLFQIRKNSKQTQKVFYHNFVATNLILTKVPWIDASQSAASIRGTFVQKNGRRNEAKNEPPFSICPS